MRQQIARHVTRRSLEMRCAAGRVEQRVRAGRVHERAAAYTCQHSGTQPSLALVHASGLRDARVPPHGLLGSGATALALPRLRRVACGAVASVGTRGTISLRRFTCIPLHPRTSAGDGHGSAPPPAPTASAAVCSASPPSAPTGGAAEVRLPRILFFGGDAVSVTALAALHERLLYIVRAALRAQRGSEPPSPVAAAADAARASAMVRDHLTVVCPYLPGGITPEAAARRFSRQYPVARFAVDHSLAVIPVDHPRSLAKSTLLAEMMTAESGASANTSVDPAAALAGARQWRARVQAAERQRRAHGGREGKDAEERQHGRLRVLASSLAATVTHSLHSTAVSVHGESHDLTTHVRATPVVDARAAALSEAPPQQKSLWACHGRSLRAYDLAVVVSFRYFLPARLLRALPPTINLHPSLLPLYRGASPIFSTLMRNEPVGGASVIQLRADQRLMDSGDVLWQCAVPLPKDADIRSYMPLVTQLGAAGLCDTIFGESTRCGGGGGSPGNDGNSSVQIMHAERPACTISAAAEGVADPLQRKEKEENGGGGGARVCERRVRAVVSAKLHASLPPPFITPAVIDAAMRAHSSYVLYCEHCALTGTTPSSPSASQRELTCGDNFPASVRSGYCDWPDSFWLRWRAAAPQQYATFGHFSEDPYHAPLLPRDAAVLRFSCVTGTQAFGVWRAFVGGQYFKPAVNASLDKGCTPVRNQLAKRTLRRLVGEKQRALQKARSKRVPHEHGSCRRASTEREEKKRRRHRHEPVDVRAAAKLVDAAMLQEVEDSLRLSCTFTKAVHPDLVPAAVLDELEAVETTPLTSTRMRMSADHYSHAARAHGTVAAACGAKFFRQPPPILNCTKLKQRLKEVEEELRRRRRERDVGREGCRGASAPACQGAGVEGPRGATVPPLPARGEDGAAGDDDEEEAAMFDSLVLLKAPELRAALSASPGEAGNGGSRADRRQRHRARKANASGIDHGGGRTAADTTALGAASEGGEEEDALDGSEEEEAPEGYVPDVILAAPPSPPAWISVDLGVEVGSDYMGSARSQTGAGGAVARASFHIPTGTAYFPVCAEDLCAIKCKEGWFFWKEAHLKYGTRAQPAVFLRRGMAMKTGVLYAGLFSEYCK